MEILKQPLPQGGFLPTGETHCPESWDMAKGCRTGHSPAQARGFTPHQFSFQHLLYEQECPAHGQTLAEELQETGQW